MRHHISDPKSTSKEGGAFFDVSHKLEADTGILSLRRNGLSSSGSKIAAVQCNDLIDHPPDIFNGPRHLTQQEIDIDCGAALKLVSA